MTVRVYARTVPPEYEKSPFSESRLGDNKASIWFLYIRDAQSPTTEPRESHTNVRQLGGYEAPSEEDKKYLEEHPYNPEGAEFPDTLDDDKKDDKKE
jgi:hypothetical protein